MATQRNHQNNFATNLTSNQIAGVTTTPLNSIPSVAAPFSIALDATNINGKYEIVEVTSKTATNINHAATTYAHTTAEEVRMVVGATELDEFAAAAVVTKATGAEINTGTEDAKYVTPKAIADSVYNLSAYAEVTSNQTSITTEVDLTSLSATIVIPTGGRRIKISALTFPSSNVANEIARVQIKESTTVLNIHQTICGVANQAQSLFGQVSFVATAGSHTYKLTMQRIIGTGTLISNAASTYPAFILIETV